jgi:hypothetical protein
MRHCRKRGFAWLFLAMVWTSAVQARTVAIIRPAIASPELVETVTRLRGELLAVGYEARVVTSDAQLSTPSAAQPAWREALEARELDAVLVIVGDAPPFSVDVWTMGPSERARVAQVVALAMPKQQPGELPIRAIEVLRAALLETEMARDPSSAKPPNPPAGEAGVTVAEVAPRPSAASFERLSGAVGVASLSSLDGMGPAFLLTLRLEVAIEPWISLQAAAAGLGTRPSVRLNGDSARIAHSYALLGARYRFGPEQRIVPYLAGSIGALSTLVEGRAEAPRRGHNEARWSLLFEGSVGADLFVFERYYVGLGGHVHLAQPGVAIHILDTVVATTGGPNLGLALTVGAWL